MEALLYQARRLRCEWANVYDPARIARRRARRSRRCRLEDARAAVVRAISNKARRSAIVERLETLHAAATRFVEHARARGGCSPSWTRCVEGTKDIFAYLLDPTAWPA